MTRLNIAVVGSGISGLSAAWLLSKKHQVTLFEADERIGGHSNTVTIDVDGKRVDVDTGFICYNEATYPNLIALFDHLGVRSHDTSMSFSASMGGGSYEYSGGTWLGLGAQPLNMLRPSHWRMMRDIVRFFREAGLNIEAIGEDETIGAWLERHNYGDEFRHRHLIPMAAAIWSSSTGDMMAYPARAFLRFFQNHGLIQLNQRPKWRSVLGGSKVYVERLIETGNFETVINHPVTRIVRDTDGVTLFGRDGMPKRFDHVVIASHADQALAMLDQPDAEEAELLGAFSYSKNHAVLHRDPRYMPKRKLAWASWNYIDWGTSPLQANHRATQDDLCLTYWMNSLQNLATDEDIFVTLNPPADAAIENAAASFNYTHPIFDTSALAAQSKLWSLQGNRNTWYCGAHFGAGFHEDGLQSGLAVAEQLGQVRRPWNVANESYRITLGDAQAASWQAAAIAAE
ncbi:NAD(P)/FAD-dependent oxidoreductase [Pseudahrensia aquimaris]|uniref:NAD(P)/FAD-dependent oxidoreductase n=1 Tax=Pseudahrensia aquimaris TaxID=744461 RepID=A0ABW3FCV3_9HYPH